MSKPLIVVLSRDEMMASELPGLFRGRAEIRACQSFDEFVELARNQEPSALLADFRRSSGSGRDEARTIAAVQLQYPRVRLAMVTPVDCPEDLEHCASNVEMTHFRGHLDRSKLLNVFGPLVVAALADTASQPPETKISFPQLIAIDSDPLGCLTGTSRRFETWSADLSQTLTDLEIAAMHDVALLLIGETGVGTRDLARLIHEISTRRHEPFLTVSCGALPRERLERELFGQSLESGSVSRREGTLLTARRGTVLLDDIDSLGLEQQTKLLRLIETKEFEPVDSSLTYVCQPRLILSATHSILPLVEQGDFRADLYYRLNSMKFVIPPLRHRTVDVAPLTRKFIRQFSFRYGVHIAEVKQDVFAALQNYPWPGNARELENVVQQVVLSCRSPRLIKSHFPQHVIPFDSKTVDDHSSNASDNASPNSTAVVEMDDWKRTHLISMNEKDLIEQTLFQNRFRRTSTAKQLGISRMTLYNKMKKYGLQN